MPLRPLLATTLCLTVATCTLVGVSFAGSKTSKPVKQTEFRAKLEPCCGEPELDATGKAKRRIQAPNSKKQKEEFDGKITIPVPGLGITDEATAMEADLRLLLSREDTPYAECLLEFDEFETEEDEGESHSEAEYTVNVRSQMRKGIALQQARKGTCDTDLGTEGIQLGVPDVQAGDVITATLVVDPEDRSQDIFFLEGTFAKKK
jgi:hypothetical protein